jgi:hypothetical protein
LVVARDARVVWAEGRLYVIRTPTDIVVFETDEPKKRSGQWEAKVGEGFVRFMPPGCGSCRRRIESSPIGRMSRQDIYAAGTVDA